ncbi:hypothetical protein BsWGS_12887 [Bradybaena similaris]
MPRDLKKNLADLPEVDSDIDERSEFYRKNVVPVDRGWAWVICFAGFLVYFVFGISNQTMVVLFVELINMYNTTITMGSLVFMFSVFSVGTMSIISTNFLAPRYGERAVVSVAGFFNMCGSLGLSFSPTIGAFIVWAVLKGLATGAVFVPSISLIRLYFNQRRSIAQIMANVGQSFAVIIVPPVIRIIRKHYGISGTFIVVAGIELHMTVAGLLLRPISSYRYRPRISRRLSKAKAMEEVMISEDYNEFKLDPKYKILVKRMSTQALRSSWVNNSERPEGRKAMVFDEPLLIQKSGTSIDTTKSQTQISAEGNEMLNSNQNQNKELQNINDNKFSANPECVSGPSMPDCSNNSNDKNGAENQQNKYVVPSTAEKTLLSGADTTMSSLVNRREEVSERNLMWSANTNQSMNTKENRPRSIRESVRRSRASELRSSYNVDNLSESESEEMVLVATGKHQYSGAADLFVISVEEASDRRWLFRMVLLATIPGSANLYVRNYIPAVTEGQGASLDESAILLTIVGATDLVSRLCIGLFADTHILTSVQIIIITQLCLASVCHCLRFFEGFEPLIAFVILMGAFVGTRISVLPLLSMEIVGVENMPQALSIISTIGALSSAFMNPIFGSVAQKYGNYVTVMNLVGSCFTVSSIIMIMMPCVLKLRRMNRARQAKKLNKTPETSSQRGSMKSEKRVSLIAGSSVDIRKKRSSTKVTFSETDLKTTDANK